jgi:hypothetical protein
VFTPYHFIQGDAMNLSLRRSLELIGVGLSAVLAVSIKATDYPAHAIITRDVAVIGGGSAGTYAAIGLRDLGKSVVVVEQQDRLGGHTQTYHDQATGATIDYGVILFHQLDIVKKYFARFNIPLTIADISSQGVTKYVDFHTGKAVRFIPPNSTEALGVYALQLAQYPYLNDGFELPDQVPEDLLLPFGDFVTKYKLDAAVNTIFQFGQGLGDLLSQPTIYVFKNFHLDVLKSIATGFLTTKNHDNSELYEKAQAELGVDALLNSRVLATNRDCPDGYTHLLVKTPSGVKLIRAKKIVLTIPPKLGNLQGFDLDKTERKLFGQFSNSAYYTGILRNSGIPEDTTVANVGPNTRDNLPALPGVYSIMPTGVKGLANVKYGSAVALSDAQVKANIIAGVTRLRKAGTLDTTTPEFAVFSSHTPFELTVPAKAIKKGFYKELYGLQGHRNTYYSGATFNTHDSTEIWRFTEALLPKIAKNS